MAKLKVDMTNVEERVVVPEGDYICKVAKIELQKSQEKGTTYLKWTYVIGAGEHKGSKLYDNTSLQPKALFHLRGVLVACGLNVPKSVMSFDTDLCIGKIVGITVAHEDYKGKPSVKCGDIWKAAKGANGWGRADAIAAQKVADEAEEEEDEGVDTSAEVDVDSTIDDGVDEIDV